MNSLNSISKKLIEEIRLSVKYKERLNLGRLETDNRGSTLALAYEKARNAVEYRDEHLIRQSAIERILTRRLFLNQSDEKIANLLLKELTWARYYDPNLSNDNLIKKIKEVVEKYRNIGLLIPSSDKSKILTGLCACEIDEILNFEPTNQILINYFVQILNKQIQIELTDERQKNIQIYIAVERGYAKNSEMLIRYKLLKALYPNWKKEDNSLMFSRLDEIENYLNYENRDLIRRKVVQMSPPLNLIRDFIITNKEKLTDDFDEKYLIDNISPLLDERYKSTKDKLIRASKRSIIYIFLTKMVLAILIEIPFEILFGKINYFALLTNIVFPPTLMFLFNSSVDLPGKNNTKVMIDKVRKYFFEDEDKFDKEEIIINSKISKTYNIFYYIFLLSSFALLIGIIFVLNILNFNFISQIIFLFFLSVVSFFAFRVREISKEYTILTSENQSFFETLIDYLFLPIVKIGQWLSQQVSKINILSFIFDFIIEAPLKTFLEIFEQWLHFVRVKKEELLG